MVPCTVNSLILILWIIQNKLPVFQLCASYYYNLKQLLSDSDSRNIGNSLPVASCFEFIIIAKLLHYINKNPLSKGTIVTSIILKLFPRLWVKIFIYVSCFIAKYNRNHHLYLFLLGHHYKEWYCVQVEQLFVLHYHIQFYEFHNE